MWWSVSSVSCPKRKMIGVGNAVLYRSKKDIDRHVQEQFEKLNNEHEVCNLMGVHLVKPCESGCFLHLGTLYWTMRQRFPVFDCPSSYYLSIIESLIVFIKILSKFEWGWDKINYFVTRTNVLFMILKFHIIIWYTY